MKADEIKAIRNELGLSQEAFAIKLGVSPRTVQNWESGGKIPDSKIGILESLRSGKGVENETDQRQNETLHSLDKMLDALNESLKQNSRLIGIIERMQEKK